MTVPNASNKSGPYVLDGVAAVFARTFLIVDADHLAIIRTENGVETEITTGFIIDGVGNFTGNVTISPALTGGTVTLLRRVPNSQETDYSNQAKVAPAQVENDFDLVVMQIQDLAGQIEGIDTDAAILAATQAESAATQAEAAADRAEAAADLVEEITAGQSSSETTYVYIATSGQLVFSGADAFGATLSFSSLPDVFHEGQWLSPNQFTANSALDTITLSYPVTLGDTVGVKVRNWTVGNDAASSNYRGETIEHALDRASYAEIASPYTVKPLGFRWPLQAFAGANAEGAKLLSVQSWVQVLDKALKSGEHIEISRGVWPMREKLNALTGISILDDTPIDVRASGGAEILLGSEYPWTSGGFLDIRTVSLPTIERQQRLSWIGGKFNLEALPYAGGSGVCVFDIFQRTGFRIQDVQFWAGVDKNGGLWGNADTGIVTHNCAGGVIENCDFVGFYDAGVYLSGSNNDPPVWNMSGEGDTVTRCRFRRTNNMITFKRNHLGAKLIDNMGFEVGNGYLASPATGPAGNEGESIQVRGGRITKCRGRPIYLATGLGANISDMTIEDFGHEILTPTVVTAVSAGNNIAGVDVRGVNGAIVHDMTICLREWAGSTADAPNKAVIGIRTGADNQGVYSSNALIHHNRIEKLHRPLYDDPSCSLNRYEDNVEVDAVAGTILPSSILGTNSILLKSQLQFMQSIDPASIAAGASLVLTITATGVTLGDWIDSWSLGNRSSSTVGLPGLGIEVYAVTDGVEFVLKNNTSGEIDIGNTNFSARVRKA